MRGNCRLLAAADMFAALTESRPYRAAVTPDQARVLLSAEAAAGRLDPDACAAVIAGAGLRWPPRTRPCDLIGRSRCCA